MLIFCVKLLKNWGIHYIFTNFVTKFSDNGLFVTNYTAY